MLKNCSAALIAAVLASCAGVNPGAPPVVVGPNPTPSAQRPARFEFYGEWHVHGQGKIGDVGITSMFQFDGHALIEFTPIGPPFIRIDGESDFTISPLPGLEAEAQKSLDAGEVVVTVEGKRMKTTRTAPPITPPPPMPVPTPPVVKPPEPVAVCLPGGACDIPNGH